MNFFYETNRLLLKTLNVDSSGDVLEFLYKNKEIFEPFEPAKPPAFYTTAYQESVLRTENLAMLGLKFARFYVFIKNNPNKIIGSVSLGNMQPFPFLSASIGYKFDYQYHGCGYATEALKQLIDIAFNELQIHRLEAYVLPENIPSLKLMDRLEFLQEGITTHKAKINGVWQDNMQYSLINYKN